jgi:hypothetical protein
LPSDNSDRILQEFPPERYSTYTRSPLQDALDPARLLGQIVPLRGCTGDEVRTRQSRSGLEPARELVEVEWIDQHAGVGRDEFGWAADARRHDGAPAGERLEDGLAERLDKARLADDA